MKVSRSEKGQLTAVAVPAEPSIQASELLGEGERLSRRHRSLPRPRPRADLAPRGEGPAGRDRSLRLERLLSTQTEHPRMTARKPSLQPGALLVGLKPSCDSQNSTEEIVILGLSVLSVCAAAGAAGLSLGLQASAGQVLVGILGCVGL